MIQTQEAQVRRETFQPEVPIRLADGQFWEFPRPRIAWRLTQRDDVLEPEPRTTLGHAFDLAMKGLGALRDKEGVTVSELAMAVLCVGAAMLAENYELGHDDIYNLLEYDPENEENLETWKAILDVARGNAPKP